MRVIVITSIAIFFLIMNCSAFALSIIKPQKGDTYLVGQTLTVELQPLPDESVEQIILTTKHFSGAAFNNTPFRYVVKLDKPVDGEEPIGVVAELKNGKTILLTTYIYVKLPADVEVKGIILESDLLTVTIRPDTNRSRSIRAYGIESSGKKYPIKHFSQVNYQSLNEAIATVDSNGVIKGVYPGKTKVIVSSGNVFKEVKVFVEYEIDPLKGITATPVDKSNEIKWERSPYEGDVVSLYRIYRSESEYGLDKEIIGTVAPGTYTFTDTQQAAGVKYYYSVQAFSQKYNTGSSMKNLWFTPQLK